MMCGTQLAAAEQTGRRERRVVSVLFCDLVGFTSRSEQQDIEDVEGFLSGYHQLLRRELERHGGHGGEVHRGRGDGAVWRAHRA